MTAEQPVLAIEDATVAYGARTVLDRVSLTVRRGEVVAVLGANGEGKSTLIRAALGLVPLVTGQVRLFGRPLRRAARAAAGRTGNAAAGRTDNAAAGRPDNPVAGARFRGWDRIGYVPQRMGAGSGVPATVREVVSAGRLARRRLLRPSRAADRVAVDGALAAVGLADRAADPVAALSGGQQQRTLIARALASQPELLVLDEPTAGVDAASQQAFADALRDFVDGGGTVVLVAHELGPLEPLVSRAVVVHHGTIAHDGAVPRPAGYHGHPDHDHVHPHATEEPGMWQG